MLPGLKPFFDLSPNLLYRLASLTNFPDSFVKCCQSQQRDLYLLPGWMNFDSLMNFDSFSNFIRTAYNSISYDHVSPDAAVLFNHESIFRTCRKIIQRPPVRDRQLKSAFLFFSPFPKLTLACISIYFIQQPKSQVCFA